MTKPEVIVLAGYGVNCEEETAYAFNTAGARASIIHVNDIIESPSMLNRFSIFAFPGGFSYGDDAGSGKALANKIKNNLLHEFMMFLERDTLTIGICNGFQVMVNLGIVPGIKNKPGVSEVSLEYNKTFRYECRWVNLVVEKSNCIFTRDIEFLYIPVAHGEGNFFADDATLNELKKNNMIVMRYSMPDGNPANGLYPFNPNGAAGDIAAICDLSGRRLGMMPHPERHISFFQRYDWTYIKEKSKRDGSEIYESGDGLKIFTNAVKYFT